MSQPEDRRSLGHHARKKLSPQQIATAKRERADGVTWTDLGLRFGMDAQSVKRAVEASE